MAACCLGPPAESQCGDEASVHAGSSSADTTAEQATVYNATLTSLTHTSYLLSAVQYQSLASTQLEVGSLLTVLQSTGSGVSRQTTFASQVTLSTLFSSASDVLSSAGNSSAASVFTQLSSLSVSLSQTISLSDFMALDLRDQVLDNTPINALDFVMGAVQTYNVQRVGAVQDVPLDPVDLGLQSSLSAVRFAVRAIEPPSFAGGSTGIRFSSAGMRVRMQLGLVDSSTPIDVAGLGLVTTQLTLSSLSYVVSVDPGGGGLTTLNALTQVATVRATSGASRLLLGAVSDADFADRTSPLDPASALAPVTVGTLEGTLGVISESVDVRVRGSAEGAESPLTDLDYSGGFAQTRSVSQVDFVSTLVRTAFETATVQVDAFSGALGLSVGTVSSVVQVTTTTVTSATALLATTVMSTISTVVDPALETTGARVGGLDAVVEKALVVPLGAACSDGAFCTVEDSCDGSGACVGSERTCPDDGLSCTQETCDEAQGVCRSSVATGCAIDGACWSAGSVSPGDACELCRPEVSTVAWSAAPDPSVCGDAGAGQDAGPQADGGDSQVDGGEPSDAGLDASANPNPSSLDGAVPTNTDAGTPSNQQENDVPVNLTDIQSEGGLAGGVRCSFAPISGPSRGALSLFGCCAVALLYRRRPW